MITNLIRKALGPEIETILNEERTRLQDIISSMEDAVDDVKSIRASDIADNISTYDIAQDIPIDPYEIARGIEIDASDIEVDTRDLADRIAEEIGNNIEINYSDLAREISDNIDTTGIADAVVSQIETTLEIQHQNMITVNMNNRLNEIEKKMNHLLEHFGITPENV